MTDPDQAQQFLAHVGSRVRATRNHLHLTRKQLSIQSRVSQRHLAQLETGQGNISIRLLRQIADAMDSSVEQLVNQEQDALTPLLNQIRQLNSEEKTDLGKQLNQWLIERKSRDRAGRIALIGLRGAGKSTIGRRTGEQLGIPFVELDQEIVQRSGLATEEIFSLYGDSGYRMLERECLDQIIRTQQQLILAVAGGIVTNLDTFKILLHSFHTIWLKATPEEHMGRVIAQGDRRPAKGNPDAMDNLRELIELRQPLYQRARYRLKTSEKSITECCNDLGKIITDLNESGKMSDQSLSG